MSSHVRLAALAFLLPAALGTAACGASAQARKADSFATDAPDWVTRTPEMDGKVCAVGISGPTRIPENAKNYAAENARAELSNVLGTRVYSMMLDQQTGGYGSTERTAIVQATAFSSDVVMVGSQVLETWMDLTGEMSGGTKGTAYALACLPLDASAVTALMSKLITDVKQNAANQTEEQKRAAVRQRAADAFADLEKEEQKRPATSASPAASK